MAETPAELRPSTPPRAKPSPSDAPERAFCRSSSRPSSSPAWRSSSAVQPMIRLCDDIVAGRDQAGTNAVVMLPAEAPLEPSPFHHKKTEAPLRPCLTALNQQS